MKERIINVLKIYLILLLIFIVYYTINKSTGFYIPCVFREITGYKCPGCGITHLLFGLINFKLEEAFKENPLVFIYLPFIIGYFIYKTYLYVLDKKDKFLVRIPSYLKIALLVITVLFGIIRNIIKI